MPTTETGGVHPQRARIADVRGIQVGDGAVRRYLGGDGLRDARERSGEGDEDGPARRGYGCTTTLECSTCVTGIVRPWAGSVTVRFVESCDSPPR